MSFESYQLPDDVEHLFDDPRDEAIYQMAASGWANESGGDLDCPTGLYWRMTNELRDLDEISMGFDHELGHLGVAAVDVVGHFIIVEEGSGRVSVFPYNDELAMRREYHKLVDTYEAWRLDD